MCYFHLPEREGIHYGANALFAHAGGGQPVFRRHRRRKPGKSALWFSSRLSGSRHRCSLPLMLGGWSSSACPCPRWAAGSSHSCPATRLVGSWPSRRASLPASFVVAVSIPESRPPAVSIVLISPLVRWPSSFCRYGSRPVGDVIRYHRQADSCHQPWFAT